MSALVLLVGCSRSIESSRNTSTSDSAQPLVTAPGNGLIPAVVIPEAIVAETSVMSEPEVVEPLVNVAVETPTELSPAHSADAAMFARIPKGMKASFEQFDTDADNFWSVEEFIAFTQARLARIGDTKSDPAYIGERNHKGKDANGDGQVSLAEFATRKQ